MTGHERCCLVRTEEDEITLYIHQSGPTQEISDRAVLKRYPIREWGLLPIPGEYSPTCMRWWPQAGQFGAFQRCYSGENVPADVKCNG